MEDELGREPREVAMYPEVSKSRELIRSEISVDGKASAMANRIIMVLLSQIDYEHPDLDRAYSFRVADMAAAAGVQINRRTIGSVADKMAATIAKIVEGKWKVLTPFFHEIRYNDGEIRAEFSPKIMPFLIRLRDFIPLNLITYLKLNSTYSQNLWELLSMFRHSSVMTPDYDIAPLCDKLSIPKKLRKNISWIGRILNRAKEEIEEKTDLRFVWEPDKKYKPAKIIFYLGRTRLPHVEEREKLKIEKEREKNSKAMAAWRECKNKEQSMCDNYGKSRRAKCALCRRMGCFADGKSYKTNQAQSQQKMQETQTELPFN